jgi:TDG/mug DNA glycosylase family protein
VKTKAGCDSSLATSDFAPSTLREKIERFMPQIVCFNGIRAARSVFRGEKIQYGFLTHKMGATKFFVAPSTSSAASWCWDESSWYVLAAASRSGD